MINKNILKAVLKVASAENKNIVLTELLNHISERYDYNDNKAGHVIGMLMDSNEVVTVDKFNKEYVEKNLKSLMYNCEKYNITNIRATSVDNIECTIHVEFDYIEKVNEDRGDVTPTCSYFDISFVDIPEILK